MTTNPWSQLYQNLVLGRSYISFSHKMSVTCMYWNMLVVNGWQKVNNRYEKREMGVGYISLIGSSRLADGLFLMKARYWHRVRCHQSPVSA